MAADATHEARPVDARGVKGALIGDHGHQLNMDFHVELPRPEVHWPVQVGRPPLRARAFQGRAALSQPIAEGPGDDVVATGSGGVGKTQLVADVFARARDAGVDLLVWVNAMSRESIAATYAQALAVTQPEAAGVGDSPFSEQGVACSQRVALVATDSAAG